MQCITWSSTKQWKQQATTPALCDKKYRWKHIKYIRLYLSKLLDMAFCKCEQLADQLDYNDQLQHFQKLYSTIFNHCPTICWYSYPMYNCYHCSSSFIFRELCTCLKCTAVASVFRCLYSAPSTCLTFTMWPHYSQCISLISAAMPYLQTVTQYT